MSNTLVSKLPYLIILTASDCGACKNMHASGDFSRNPNIPPNKGFRGFRWNAPSFWKLITANENPTLKSKVQLNIIEFEFYSISKPAKIENVKSFTIYNFSITNDDDDDNPQGNIIRSIFDRESEKSDKYLYTKDDGEEIKDQEMDDSFNKLISKTFPKSLSTYSVQYPNFIYISNNEFMNALSDENYPLYAKCYGLIIAKNANNIWAPINQDNLNVGNHNKSFITYANYIISNPELLIPAISEKIEPPKSNKKVSFPKVSTVKSILKKPEDEDITTSTSYPIKVVPLSSRHAYY
jgi:hypothetical protein